MAASYRNMHILNMCMIFTVGHRKYDVVDAGTLGLGRADLLYLLQLVLLVCLSSSFFFSLWRHAYGTMNL